MRWVREIPTKNAEIPCLHARFRLYLDIAVRCYLPDTWGTVGILGELERDIVRDVVSVDLFSSAIGPGIPSLFAKIVR